MSADTWHLDPRRAPTLQDGDELLYCEPGRIVTRASGSGTDCRSHWFRIVKNGGMYSLLVQHGGGEQRVRLGYEYRNPRAIFDPLPSDARYWLMWILLEVHNAAQRAASAMAAQTYKQAFADGRLKKRKQRGQDAVKVWIESASQPMPIP